MDDVAAGQDDLPSASTASRDLGDDIDLSGAPHGYQDWRNTDQLPRVKTAEYPQGLYNRRSQPVSILVVHHTASTSDDIIFDNTYHTQIKNWNEPGQPILHAPHIAYHFYIDQSGRLTACNYLWERSWHATDANDKGVGIVCQGDFQAGTNKPSQAQLETLQFIIGTLMAYFKIDRTSVWGHGELRQYGNATTCPGQNFLPAVQGFRTGTDFAAPAGGGDPTAIRWKVVDTTGATLGLYNMTANAAAAAEQVSGVGIYQSEGQIRLDFRNAQNANPDPPAKWRVCDAQGTHLGLYNQTANAVEQAERIQGYALYMYDSPDGNIRMDFRNLGQQQ
ncbi:MAG TPA: peptidoglycan recognition family protein [Chloroflexia bacterium]|nr:peptidoglycan recognition family protein [Chloroflexia bacterium]